MTQTGTPVSLGQPLVAAPAASARGGKTGALADPWQQAGKKSAKAAKRFAELLRKAGETRKDLMGERKKAEDTAQAGIAAVNAELRGASKVEEPGSGDGAAARGTGAVSTDPREATAADSGTAAAEAAACDAPTGEEERLTRLSGNGPGGRSGEPPGSGGRIPGLDIGSITQVEVTDGAEKPGSRNQGPGTNLQPVELGDLNLEAGTPGELTAQGHEDSGAGASDGGTQADAGDAPAEGGEPPAHASGEFRGGEAGPGGPTGPAHASEPRLRLESTSDATPLRSAIARHIESSAKGGAPSVRIVLQPEHLGEVQVRVTLIDGGVCALVKVDNPQVADAVQRQMDALRASLVDQGIKIDRLEVSVAGGQDQGQPDADAWGGSEWQGQQDARGRRDSSGWELPDTYRSLFTGGGDRAEAAADGDPAGRDGAGLTALDVTA